MEFALILKIRCDSVLCELRHTLRFRSLQARQPFMLSTPRVAIRLWSCLALLLGCLAALTASATSFPPGFSETDILRPDGAATWNEAVGMQFQANGRLWVWERGRSRLDRRPREPGDCAGHRHHPGSGRVERSRHARLRAASGLRSHRLHLHDVRGRSPSPDELRFAGDRRAGLLRFVQPRDQQLRLGDDRSHRALSRRAAGGPARLSQRYADRHDEPPRVARRDHAHAAQEHGLPDHAQLARRRHACVRHGRHAARELRRRRQLHVDRRRQRSGDLLRRRPRRRHHPLGGERRRVPLADADLAVRQNPAARPGHGQRHLEQSVLRREPAAFAALAHVDARHSQWLPLHGPPAVGQPQSERRQPGRDLPRRRRLEHVGRLERRAHRRRQPRLAAVRRPDRAFRLQRFGPAKPRCTESAVRQRRLHHPVPALRGPADTGLAQRADLAQPVQRHAADHDREHVQAHAPGARVASFACDYAVRRV